MPVWNGRVPMLRLHWNGGRASVSIGALIRIGIRIGTGTSTEIMIVVDIEDVISVFSRKRHLNSI